MWGELVNVNAGRGSNYKFQFQETNTETNTEASFKNMDTNTKKEVLQKTTRWYRSYGIGPENLQYKTGLQNQLRNQIQKENPASIWQSLGTAVSTGIEITGPPGAKIKTENFHYYLSEIHWDIENLVSGKKLDRGVRRVWLMIILQFRIPFI